MSSPTPQRPTSRALLGTMALVVFMLFYVFAASLFALMVLPRGNRITEFLYYALAGLAWVPVAGLILKWMYPRRDDGKAA